MDRRKFFYFMSEGFCLHEGNLNIIFDMFHGRIKTRSNVHCLFIWYLYSYIQFPVSFVS